MEVGDRQGSLLPLEDMTSIKAQGVTTNEGSTLGVADAGPSDVLPD